jgi:hypothetical protein
MSLGRVALLGAALGFLGCGDGIERGSVAVPERSGMSPSGGDTAKPTAPGKKPAADSKVLIPGGKKM